MASDRMQSNKVVMVLGMHRSGTSALSGVLEKLGVDLGSQLLAEIKDVNDRGFFEHIDIVDLHESLLNQMGRTWMDLRPMPEKWWLSIDNEYHDSISNIITRDFSGAALWGIKDPRLCRLMPLWINVLKGLNYQPKIILCVRHPFEVVHSLKTRDYFDFHSSLILWFWHVLESEEVSRNMDRSFIVYENLLNNWRVEFSRVAKDLDLSWPKTFLDCGDNIDYFLDKKLNHATVGATPGSSRLANLALHLYESIRLENTIDTSIFNAVKKDFIEELEGILPYLESFNHYQLRSLKLADQERALRAEKQNSKEQVEYRDALIEDLRSKLRAEKQNSKEQVEYRDALIEDLEERLCAEKQNAREQIEYRDALNQSIETKLTDIASSRKELLKLLIKPIVK